MIWKQRLPQRIAKLQRPQKDHKQRPCGYLKLAKDKEKPAFFLADPKLVLISTAKPLMVSITDKDSYGIYLDVIF